MRTPFSLALLLIPLALFATEDSSSNELQDLTQDLSQITQSRDRTAGEYRLSPFYHERI